MKTIVIYSSLTGNTKMIAEAITKVLPENTDCVSVDNIPEDLATYDLAFVGYWVDKGGPDAKSKALLEELKVPNVAIFATLGAYPDSDHAQKSLNNGAALLANPESVVGRFICQGKVNPKLSEAMSKRFPKDHPHGMNPERIKRLEEASKHPNEEDCQNAQAFAKEVMSTVGVI